MLALVFICGGLKVGWRQHWCSQRVKFSLITFVDNIEMLDRESMSYLKDGCQQFKSIIKFSAAIYVSLLYAITLGSTVESESEVVEDLLFAVGCIFTLSSINMYYRSLQLEQTTDASIFPESVLDEELSDTVSAVVVNRNVENRFELEELPVEVPPSFVYQLMAVMKVVCGGLSSAYRGGIAALLVVSSLGFSNSTKVVGGIGFMLIFTLAKFPHFAGTPITRNERILVPTRVVSSFSSALIAFRLVPEFTPVLMFLSQCAFSVSVFVVEYRSDRRRVFGGHTLASWEKILILGVSAVYSLIATPDEVSPFKKLNALNVFLCSASSVTLSWVFFRYYNYTVEPQISRSTAIEEVPAESPSPSPPLLRLSQSSVG